MNCEKINSLIKRLKKGEKKYFQAFYDKTKVTVYYTIRKIIKRQDLIEDVMQDTYIKFINSLSRIDENNNPYSYLITIARNQAIDYCKKNSRMELTDDMEVFDGESNEQTAIDMPLLNYCKMKLTEEEFKILELTIVMGYKRVEVAKILNEPISTVNWKYNNILKKIKPMYKEVYEK